jgi:hypothetical protein
MAETKDEIAAERDSLRDQVAVLQDELEAATAPVVPIVARPERPDFGLSAGELSDLEMHGVTVSPFTGETLTATLEGVTPQTPTAIRNDARETALQERASNPMGPAPAAEAPYAPADEL